MPFIIIEISEQQEARIANCVTERLDFQLDGGRIGGAHLLPVLFRFRHDDQPLTGFEIEDSCDSEG